MVKSQNVVPPAVTLVFNEVKPSTTRIFKHKLAIDAGFYYLDVVVCILGNHRVTINYCCVVIVLYVNSVLFWMIRKSQIC